MATNRNVRAAAKAGTQEDQVASGLARERVIAAQQAELAAARSIVA